MTLFLGFYFGTLSMVLLYNLHWYYVTKERSYLYYAIFRAALIVVVSQSTGMLETNQFFVILNANILFILILLFSKNFLGLKENFKKINTAMNVAMTFVLLCFFYSVITGDYAIFDQSYAFLISPFVLVGYFVYLKGFKPAKYYVLAWGISLSLIGLDDLNKFGVVRFHSEIPFTLIGHIIESIILSYAISVKTELIIVEKEQQGKMLIHQAKLASMGQMLENISHQWRQPLNRIATFIINMQTYINNEYKNETYLPEALKQSQLQLEYMSSTINDFTNFNKRVEDKEHFLASESVQDACNIIAQTLEKNDIKLDVTIRSDFSIHSYPSELAQVILNLIQNAQDVLIKRKVKQAAISVFVDRGRISVQDNAGGVADEVIDHIFEPYFTTQSKASSLGLGLTMSRMILGKYFNAKIEIEQVRGRTYFNILFGSSMG